jgi:hypothetical protein
MEGVCATYAVHYRQIVDTQIEPPSALRNFATSLGLQILIKLLFTAGLRDLNFSIFGFESTRSILAREHFFDQSSLPFFVRQSATEKFSRPLYDGAYL